MEHGVFKNFQKSRTTSGGYPNVKKLRPENQRFSDFLKIFSGNSRTIRHRLQILGSLARKESALGELMTTKQKIVYSFIGSYTGEGGA